MISPYHDGNSVPSRCEKMEMRKDSWEPSSIKALHNLTISMPSLIIHGLWLVGWFEYEPIQIIIRFIFQNVKYCCKVLTFDFSRPMRMALKAVHIDVTRYDFKSIDNE